MTNLTFTTVTVNNSFQNAELSLTPAQMDGIIQLIQASGITPSIPITSANLTAIVMRKDVATDGTVMFNMTVRTA